MRNLVKVLILSTSIALSGCGGVKDDEPKTYGVRNSKWKSLSIAQQQEAAQRYEHEIRVSEQRKMEELHRVQNEKLAQKQMDERLGNLEKRQTYGYMPAPTTVIVQQPAATVAQAPAQQQAQVQQQIVPAQPQAVVIEQYPSQ